MPRNHSNPSQIIERVVAKLVTERTRLRMSKNELAQRSGVSRRAIALIEKGERPQPTLETLLKLSNGLGLQLWEVLKAAQAK